MVPGLACNAFCQAGLLARLFGNAERTNNTMQRKPNTQ
jgi:hypothetical protein